jgi:hypothetical protein
MGRFLGGAVLGLVLGGVLTFFMFVGAPRAGKAPGAPIKPPDATVPAGTAQIVLRQDFFNDVLTTIFRDMNQPSFELSSSTPTAGSSGPEYALFQQPCDGKINILAEGTGVQTGVSFENNRITAPLAFTGNYRSSFGCFPFSGWAQSNFELRYDAAQQMVFGQLNVETVNLEGVNPIVNAIATPLVQSTLNTRVNPIRILDAKQLAVDVPVASTAGRLQASVSDVRAEVKDNALNLYITYSFSGAPLS